MKGNEFKLLNTSDSWRSELAVIAHIDLDAFYAQCQGVSLGIDPTKPLACRQWHSVIAVNYPARSFGIKRGMNIAQCRDLCPEIELPHVPTFKKGSTSWQVEKAPASKDHKVSLDFFRAESRKIFKIFRESFAKVEKAGIDEGFVDLGPEVYAKALELYPQLDSAELPIVPEGYECWHDCLLSIGADMVNATRLKIHDQLKYTCSAGIAGTKQLAKLGSAFKKPFNQTLVLHTARQEFLNKHKLTDLWGWGGKRGQQVLEALGVEDNPGKIAQLGLDGIMRIFNDMEKAKSLYDTVTGNLQAEVKLRTIVKSMASVKNFTSTPLNSMDDLRDWLIVYCSDLAGRLEDITLDDPEQLVYRPKTIAVRYDGGVTRTKFSKQTQCSLPYHKSPLEALMQAVWDILPSAEKRILPCTQFTIELGTIAGIKPTTLFTKKETPATPVLEEEESLFVEETQYHCKKCNQYLPAEQESEHNDWHLAKSLQSKLNVSPSKPKSNPNSPKRSAVQKRPPKGNSKGQQSLLKFFSKNT